jgi:hypothetical protein
LKIERDKDTQELLSKQQVLIFAFSFKDEKTAFGANVVDIKT